MFGKWLFQVICLFVLPLQAQQSLDKRVGKWRDLPADLQYQIERLPDKALSLSFILKRAAAVSSDYKLVLTEFMRVELPKIQARSHLGITLSAEAAKGENRSEPLNAFSPSPILTDVTKLGASGYFITGTKVTGEITHTDSTMRFTAIPSIEGQDEVKANVTIAQNLWKDAFGVATRWGLQAGDLLSAAQDIAAREKSEQWVVFMVDVFYSAWLAQNEMAAAMMAQERKERLFKITQIKLNRGTAEKPDFLQVRGALTAAELQVTQNRLQLESLWRALVITLDFPREWLQANPLYVPVQLDSEAESSVVSYCEASSSPTKESLQIKQFQLLSEAAHLQLRQSKNMMMPELALVYQWTSNGVDDRVGVATKEFLRAEHPGWLLGLQLRWTLGNDAMKANLEQATVNEQIAEHQLAKNKTDLAVKTVNSCEKFKALRQDRKKLEKLVADQGQRLDLEERRYSLGRSTVLNVIQAGDDATNAELQLRRLEVELRKTSWQVLQLHNEVLPAFEKMLL